MMTSLVWFACSALFASPAPPAAELKSPGWSSWQEGQKKLQNGETDRAIELFEDSLTADPRLARNYLSLAAAYLDKPDEGKACLYLMLYVAAHPEHLAVRFQYVDLLQRLKRITEARQELESIVAEVQEAEKGNEHHLIQCHSRLMQLAELTRSKYEQHLHRGIGLFLLAGQREHMGVDPDLMSRQGLLCKSAAELTLAARDRPDEARPQFYLHEVWQRLAQSQPARKSLHAAEAAAPFSSLTPAEQRRLHLACRQGERESTRR
jgi:hypothetical protein